MSEREARLIDKILKSKADYEEMLEEQSRTALKEIFDAFFVENPDVESIRWNQYSPHFNDGDPCVFGVNEVYVKLKEASLPDEQEDDDDDDDDYRDAWSFRVHNPALEKSIDTLSEQLSDVEDLMESVFGDHVEVTVYPDRIETEEYSHD